MKIINTLWDSFLKIPKSEQEKSAEDVYLSIKDLIDKKIINKNEKLLSTINTVNEKKENIIIDNVEDLLSLLVNKFPTENLLKEIPKLYNKKIDDALILSTIKKDNSLSSFENYSEFEKNILPIFESSNKEYILKLFSPVLDSDKKFINNVLNLITKDHQVYKKISEITGTDFLKSKILNMDIVMSNYNNSFYKKNIDNIQNEIPELKTHHYENGKSFLMMILRKKPELFDEYTDYLNYLEPEIKEQVKIQIIESNNPIKNKIYLYENWYNETSTENYKDVLDQYLVRYSEIDNDDYEVILKLAKQDSSFKKFLEERENNIFLNIFKGKDIKIKLIKDYMKEFPELKDKKSNKTVLKHLLYNVPYDVKKNELKLKQFIIENFEMEILLGSDEKNFNNFPWLEIKNVRANLNNEIIEIVKNKVNDYALKKGFDKVNVKDIFDSYDDFIKKANDHMIITIVEENKKFIEKISKRKLPLKFFEEDKIKRAIQEIDVYTNRALRSTPQKNARSFLNLIDDLKRTMEKKTILDSLNSKDKNEIIQKPVKRL